MRKEPNCCARPIELFQEIGSYSKKWGTDLLVSCFLCNFATEMKITDAISSLFGRVRNHTLLAHRAYVSIDCGNMQFGRVVFLNALELKTDIYSEVIWKPKDLASDTEKFKGWKAFADSEGQRLLTEMPLEKGYVVIGYRQEGEQWMFWQMQEGEYTERTMPKGRVVIEAKDESVNYYVLKTPTFDVTGMSEYKWCKPYIKLLDNAMNASNTICERLGTLVLVSPKTPASANMAISLNEEEKKDLEQAIQQEYGALKKQNQIMLLPSEVNAQTINLAGLDQRTNERVLLAAKVIADRLKVPANQIALIDAMSSKALANGSEIREGDLAKYRSFRRYLDYTLFAFAEEIGLKVDYIIENEPKTQQGDKIEQGV